MPDGPATPKNSTGIVPVNLLLDASNDVNEVIAPTIVGIVPESWLFEIVLCETQKTEEKKTAKQRRR